MDGLQLVGEPALCRTSLPFQHDPTRVSNVCDVGIDAAIGKFGDVII